MLSAAMEVLQRNPEAIAVSVNQHTAHIVRVLTNEDSGLNIARGRDPRRPHMENRLIDLLGGESNCARKELIAILCWGSVTAIGKSAMR